ncbi:transporter substrate-binding domain-containing protein [Martelella radicis]|uniref:ABC-type amino acid transport substrate-binding protein n=1 Tax=Martelella radicis TaxID=1397476 RepID=A0A7W6KP91_9HYPH|nr:transporter substrate-binding domain-containing protein [Martelella radicis]MBB4123458.1 ABC-type amino acid transport substrate-binding protein [Martelella radicis]
MKLSFFSVSSLSAMAALLRLVSLLLLFLPAGAIWAQQPADQTAAAEQAPVAVGVHAVPPFVMKDRDGSWYGLGVDMMNALGRSLDIDYRFVETDPADMVARVEDGTLGAAIGPVPINARDEAVIDFSQPYYSGSVGVAVRLVDRLGPRFMLELLTSPAFLYMLGLLTGPVFIIGALIWLLERRANPEQFEPRPARGVFSGFWWATVTMTTVGYGDKAPVTFLGRLLAMFWMFAALILAAITTAQLAAGLTSSINTSAMETVGDLGGLDVGTVAGSSASAELDILHIDARDFADVNAGLDALARDEIDAFVYDRAALQWGLRNYSGLYLAGLSFSQQNYGLILPQNDPKRDAINIAILSTLASEQWHLIVDRYLPSDGR